MKEQNMTTKHVPGPWKYHLGNGANPRFHIQNIGGYQIASTTELVTPKTAKLSKDFDENPIKEANARLIAAAPELLEACQGMVDAYGTCECVEGEGIPKNHCPWCIARAAIQHAEGQQ